MPRKFIKGKDGKFQGSLPDSSSIPKAVPGIPQQSHQSTIELESGFDGNGKYFARETEASQREYRRLQARLGL